jgi:hypothetical protein
MPQAMLGVDFITWSMAKRAKRPKLLDSVLERLRQPSCFLRGFPTTLRKKIKRAGALLICQVLRIDGIGGRPPHRKSAMSALPPTVDIAW